MSIEHMAVVLHHSKSKGTAKLVLLGIANHQGDGGAWPSLSTLATYANVDVRNVRKALAQLRGRGEVRVHVQDGGPRELDDQLRPNRYDVLVTCPPWCDRTPQHRDTRKRGTNASQLSLWKTPRTKAPPRTDSPGGPPDESAPLTTPQEHSQQVVAQPQDARARPLDHRPCSVCSMPQRTCEARQTKLLPEDQHHYSPGPRP